MTGPERGRTLLSLTVAGLLAVGVAVLFVARTDPASVPLAIAGGAVFLVVLVAWHARRGRHTPWAVAATHVAPDHAVVLWKPGCPRCEALLRALGRDDRITWVNVWLDADANAVVRSHNDGNELTPTVFLGDEVFTEASAARLTERLDAAH